MRLGLVRNIKIVIVVAALLCSVPGMALDLNTAKSMGLVGEQTNGYLGAVKSSADVDALVSEINRQRKEAYSRIAAKNGTTIEQVGKLAGQKLFKKATADEFLLMPETGWKMKREVFQSN